MFISKDGGSQRSQASCSQASFFRDEINMHIFVPTGEIEMQTMKTSLMMDKIGHLVINTVLIAAIPAAALASLLQAL